MRPGQDLLWALPDPYSHFRLSGTVDVTPLGNSKMVVHRQRRRTRFFAVSDFFEPVERGKVLPFDGCLRHEEKHKRIQEKLVLEEATSTRLSPAPLPEDVSTVQQTPSTAPRHMVPMHSTRPQLVSLGQKRRSRRSSQKQASPRLQGHPSQESGLLGGLVTTAVYRTRSADILPSGDALTTNDVAPMNSLDENMEEEQEAMDVETGLCCQLEKELDEEPAEVAMDSETDVEEGEEGERKYGDVREMFDPARLELKHDLAPTTSSRTRDRRRMSWASDATLVESDEECGSGVGPYVDTDDETAPDDLDMICLSTNFSSNMPNVDSLRTT